MVGNLPETFFKIFPTFSSQQHVVTQKCRHRSCTISSSVARILLNWCYLEFEVDYTQINVCDFHDLRLNAISVLTIWVKHEIPKWQFSQLNFEWRTCQFFRDFTWNWVKIHDIELVMAWTMFEVQYYIIRSKK